MIDVGLFCRSLLIDVGLFCRSLLIDIGTYNMDSTLWFIWVSRGGLFLRSLWVYFRLIYIRLFACLFWWIQVSFVEIHMSIDMSLLNDIGFFCRSFSIDLGLSGVSFEVALTWWAYTLRRKGGRHVGITGVCFSKETYNLKEPTNRGHPI